VVCGVMVKIGSWLPARLSMLSDKKTLFCEIVFPFLTFVLSLSW
jgi:hypothetical protein